MTLKNLKIFISFIFIGTIFSCYNGNLVDLENHFNEVLANNNSHEQVVVRLDTINSFEWDNLLVVGPYSSIEKIAEKEKIDLGKIPNNIQHHDRFILIVFLNDHEGIKWIEVDRTKILDQLMCDGKGYCIYPKSQSDFLLNN